MIGASWEAVGSLRLGVVWWLGEVGCHASSGLLDLPRKLLKVSSGVNNVAAAASSGAWHVIPEEFTASARLSNGYGA